MCNLLKRVKRHFELLGRDRTLCWTFYVCAVLLASHIYMLIDSGFKVEPAVRVIYCCIYFVAAIIFGRKCWDFQMLLIAFMILYCNKWNNYTSWVILLVVAYRHYHYRNFYILAYIIAEVVCLAIRRRDIVHTCLHFTHCFCIYCLLGLAKIQINSAKELVLTDAELVILRQLAAGKMKKEIKEYSKNTVTAKIKEACDRNKCLEGELIWRFKQHPL